MVLRDIGIVALSLCVALLLGYTNTIEQLLKATQEMHVLGSFVAGLFYTSIFTTVPATIALAKIAHGHAPLETALWGSIGALTGDMLIFRFARESISPIFTALVQKLHGKMGRSLSHPALRWIPIVAGVIIVASPLPDEPGLLLLGLSKAKTGVVMAFSFVANFLGILAIGLIAQSIL